VADNGVRLIGLGRLGSADFAGFLDFGRRSTLVRMHVVMHDQTGLTLFQFCPGFPLDAAFDGALEEMKSIAEVI
jgi:hypothetical protein